MGRGDRPCSILMCRYEPPRVGILPLLDTVYKERICGCLVGRECTLLRDLHPTMIGSKKMPHRVRVDNSTISTRPILPLILVNYSFQSSGERFLGLGKYIIIDVAWIIIIDGTYPTAPTQPLSITGSTKRDRAPWRRFGEFISTSVVCPNNNNDISLLILGGGRSGVVINVIISLNTKPISYYYCSGPLGCMENKMYLVSSMLM